MEIFALDASFNLATAKIPYTNLQWNRRYYECGTFEVEVPASAVSVRNWEYILSHDRPEVGIVQKIQYQNKAGKRMFLVSGFFAESKLNQIVTFPRFICDLSHTEDAIERLFTNYGIAAKKGISWRSSGKHLGNRTECDFEGEKIGDKMFSILQTRGMSLRVEIDETLSKLSAHVWHGLDRTQEQNVNPWAVFAGSFGNMENETINFDASGQANFCYVTANDGAVAFTVDHSNGGERFETILEKNGSQPEESQTLTEFKAALKQEAEEKLQDMRPVIEIDVDAVVVDSEDGDGYLSSYDLGDLVTVLIEETGVELATRIVEVNEVFKAGGHTVQLGFGTKRITNIKRAVRGI